MQYSLWACPDQIGYNYPQLTVCKIAYGYASSDSHHYPGLCHVRTSIWFDGHHSRYTRPEQYAIQHMGMRSVDRLAMSSIFAA